MKTFTSMTKVAREFCTTVPTVRQVLMEFGILDDEGKPRLGLFESGDAQPWTLEDGTPRFVLDVRMVGSALNRAGLYEPDELTKTCYIRHQDDALALLHRGIRTIGASIGFDIRNYSKVRGNDEAWDKISGFLPVEVEREMRDERNAQAPVHGLSYQTMDILVYAHHDDPSWLPGIGLRGHLTTHQQCVEVGEGIGNLLGELIETSSGVAPNLGEGAERALGEGLAMVEAVKIWLIERRRVVA